MATSGRYSCAYRQKTGAARSSATESAISIPPVPPVSPIALERHARVRLITDADLEFAVRVMLRYHLADPLVICVDFPPSVSCNGSPVRWVFARELLEQGLHVPAECGDVCVWSKDADHTITEVRCPCGLTVIEFETAVLRRFLTRTYALVPAGAEDIATAIERGLSQLFGGTGKRRP